MSAKSMLPRVILFLLCLVVGVVALVIADGNTTLTIHYHRYDGDYARWELWIWEDGKEGATYSFTGEDEFGKMAVVVFDRPVARIGFLVKLPNWEAKDVSIDRFVTPVNGKAEIWLISGDERIYTAREEADTNPKIAWAAFLDSGRIVVTLTNELAFKGTDDEGFLVVDSRGGEFKVKAVDILGRKKLRLTLAGKADIFNEYEVRHPDYAGKTVDKTALLEDPAFYYGGDDLGCHYSPQKSTFRVWTPLATEARVLLYDTANGDTFTSHEMKKDVNGTWLATIDGNLAGRYYVYEVRVNGTLRRTPDPYSRGLALNSTRTLIFDPVATDPPGWESDKRPAVKDATDIVLYEMHVRDFSIHPESGLKNKGKYLAFTETGSTGPGGVKTGIDHLKELGITHLHLLPVYDFGSIDESRSDQYNWGYDPVFYNTPEGSYATDPNGIARIREFKQMVLSLHQAGIRVVMDVVYNHTYTYGTSAFDLLVPRYFYRQDENGNYAGGSGCGNELATERPMVRKFILDSLKYWTREFRVDGYRLDLLALYDKETVRQIVKELRAIEPTILLYGEPWTAGNTPLPANQQITKGGQRGMGVAVFNDNFRDAVKGDTNGNRPGYVQGVLGERGKIVKGLEGSISDFTDTPLETINYVSCHDNLTLWDKIAKTNPGDPEDIRLRMDMIATGMVLTAQGIPFLMGGEEFARTKGGHTNSYNAGDQVNQFDYGRKVKYERLFRFYQGLIALRRAHPAFRMPTAKMVREKMEFLPTPNPGLLAFRLKDKANGDTWKTIVVIFNVNRGSGRVRLPARGMTIVVDEDEAGVTPVKTGQSKVAGLEVEVPGLSMMVLYK